MSGLVTLLPRTTAFGWYPDNLIGLVERLTDHIAVPDPATPRERLWQVRAGRVILATGAIERPLVFPGNDRPGVMLAGAARTYLHRYGVRVGQRVVVATADDSAYRAAADLHAAGVTIAAVVDQRPQPDSEMVEAVRALGIPVRAGTTIARTEGGMRLHSVQLANGTDVIACDTILLSGGWTPSVQLHAQSRGGLRFDAATGCFLPDQSAGRRGRWAPARASSIWPPHCATALAAGGGEPHAFTVAGLPAMAPPAPPAPAPVHARAFVDFQNDVTTKDLAVATSEGFVSIEHVKRYTTTGMATDQGKMSDLNALTTVAGLTGQPIEAIGLTRFRPPYTPVTFGSLAGPYRGTPVRPGPTAADRDARRRAGGCRHLEASPLLPSQRRNDRGRRGARMPGGAQRCRHVRRQHAGQDRGRRAGCRDVP